MENFKYKDGTTAQIGDICFYSEYDGKNEHYHYADSIQEIVMSGGIKLRTHVLTMDEAKSFEISEEKPYQMPLLKYAADRSGILTHLTKIGHVSTDSHMLTKDYAEANYKL